MQVDLREEARKAMENHTIRFIAVAVLVGWLAFVGSCTYGEYTQSKNVVEALTAKSSTAVEAACAYQIVRGINSGGNAVDSAVIRELCAKWAP